MTLAGIFDLPPSFRIVVDAINEVLRRVLMLPEQASTIAAWVDGLQYLEFAMYTVIAIVYMGTAVYFLMRFRRGASQAYESRTSAPGLLIVYAAHVFAVFTVFWLLGYLQYARIRAAPAGANDVYVTAKQWMWKFAYADGGASVGVLYVPVRQPVRLLLTSRDVIHSFWVPAFRLKQDAVPGTFTTLWFEVRSPGAYQIMCAQMCGAGHARMWGQVVALAGEDYDKWRRGATLEVTPDAVGLEEPAEGRKTITAPIDPVQVGRRAAAEYGCLRCHTVDGQPHIGPTWRGLYGSHEPLQNGSTITVDPAYITESMMDPTAKIVRGFPPVMPSYQGLIDPGETAAIIEFIKSLRDTRQPHFRAPLPAGPIDGVGPANPGTAPPSGSGRGTRP